MKKILIISEHLFPKSTPRANRTTELAKEFSRLGYTVTIYAVLGNYDYSSFELENNITIKKIKLKWQFQTNNSDFVSKRFLIDKIFSRLFNKLFEFPNIEFLFRIPQIINNENKFDMLISIADPHPIHWACSKAKSKFPKKFPKIWIADCGDPYFNNGRSELYKHKFKNNEKEFCNLANYISVPNKAAVDCYFPEFKKKIKVIPQGFYFKITNKINLKPINQTPTFLYAGNFFEDYRDPTRFLEHLCQLKIKFKFIIYSQHTKLVDPYVSKLGSKIEIYKIIPREKLIKVASKVDFLINFSNVNLKGQIPSKLIDYAIANRPIMDIHPNNIDKQLIIEFLKGNYNRRYHFENLTNYHISQVAKKFITLAYL